MKTSMINFENVLSVTFLNIYKPPIYREVRKVITAAPRIGKQFSYSGKFTTKHC